MRLYNINFPKNHKMEITREVKNLLEQFNNKVTLQSTTTSQPKMTLPSKDISLG